MAKSKRNKTEQEKQGDGPGEGEDFSPETSTGTAPAEKPAEEGRPEDGTSGQGETGEPAGAKAPGGDEMEALKKEIEQLKAENSDLKNQYLRKQADFENFRKRMTREKQEAIRYSNKDLILDLVAIIDDFERAIKSAEDSKDFESFKEGISLIEKQFTGMLENKWGLIRIQAEGEEFDPQRHEAMMMEESGDHDQPVVIEDYQTGYMLHDRVIRPSKVKVARPAE